MGTGPQDESAAPSGIRQRNRLPRGHPKNAERRHRPGCLEQGAARDEAGRMDLLFLPGPEVVQGQNLAACGLIRIPDLPVFHPIFLETLHEFLPPHVHEAVMGFAAPSFLLSADAGTERIADGLPGHGLAGFAEDVQDGPHDGSGRPGFFALDRANGGCVKFGNDHFHD